MIASERISPPQKGAPITVSNLRYVEHFLSQRPDLVGLFTNELYLRDVGVRHIPKQLTESWINAARDMLASKGMCSVTLMVIGQKHFGNPIPQAWYRAAEDLVRVVADNGLIKSSAEQELMHDDTTPDQVPIDRPSY